MAIRLLAYRLGDDPNRLMQPNDRGVFMNEESFDVTIFDTLIVCNSYAEQLAAYVACFIVFQLKHPRGLDSTVEIIEKTIGIRRRCESRKAHSLENII